MGMPTTTSDLTRPSTVETLALMPVVLGGPSIRRAGSGRSRRPLFHRGDGVRGARNAVTPVLSRSSRAYSDR